MNARALVMLALAAACATTKETRNPAAAAPAARATPAPSPAGAAMLPGEEVLTARPALPPLAAFDAPVPEELHLENGVRVLVVERKGAPIETLAFLVPRGSASEPARRAGLASLTAAMLEAGSAGRTQAEIAARADALGAALHSSVTPDGISVSLSAQPERLADAARLLADVALKPNFDPAEFSKVQAQRVAQLTQELAEPRIAASNAFAAALYGDAPLGHPVSGTPSTARALSLPDVTGLWRSVQPAEVSLIAVGSASPEQVVAALAPGFGTWRARAAHTTKATEEASAKAKASAAAGGSRAAAAPGDRPRLVLVEMPERPQTVLRVGQPAAPRNSPDALALRLLNSVLGGSFTSRLNQNLREKNGYTYGAGSGFAFGRLNGPFAASTSVKTQVTGAALGELLGELDRAVTQPLTPEELEKGKALLAYELVSSLEHAEGTAALVEEMVLAGLPLDDLRTTVPRLHGLTVADVQAAARRSLTPGTMTITVAGDPSVLQQFGSLQLPEPQKRTAEGVLQR